MHLSGLVICYNEIQRIRDSLESLAFCDEIVVVDSGSTDGTLEILQAMGVVLIERSFVSWNDQKEYGRTRCSGDWVLNLDADEVVSPELRAEILRATFETSEDVAGFSIRFRNHFRGHWVRRCGYYPDPHVRLGRRLRMRWDAKAVHDRVVVDGRVERLSGHIDHYSFESLDDFVRKSSVYAEAFAVRARAEGKRASGVDVLVRPIFRFMKAYIAQLGFLDGTLGLTVSGLQAYEVFQKYARLWERTRLLPPAEERP